MKELSYGVCPYRIRYNKIDILMIQALGRNDWGFIKGKVEPDEDEKETAVRECKEETGINIITEDLEDMFFSVQKRKNMGIFLVNAENVNTNTLNLCESEVSGIKWYTLGTEIEVQSNQVDVFNQIYEFISKFELGKDIQ
jgi:bis(5'-nucleosidyl)-tetraphosphatase